MKLWFIHKGSSWLDEGGLHPVWANELRRLDLHKPADLPAFLSGLNCLAADVADLTAPFVVYEHCGSTMAELEKLNHNGDLSEWTFVLALSQSSGRGRLDRKWISPPGNLYAACLWPKMPPDWKHLTPLLAGFFAADALAEFGAVVSLKWPNDLLREGRKVGGILCEERDGAIIVGIGLNLASRPEADLLKAQGSLEADVVGIDPLEFGPLTIWSAFIRSAQAGLAGMLASQSPARFVADLERRLCWIGEQVRIEDVGGPPVEGILLGLDPTGGLRIGSAGGEPTVYSGDLRLKEPI